MYILIIKDIEISIIKYVISQKTIKNMHMKSRLTPRPASRDARWCRWPLRQLGSNPWGPGVINEDYWQIYLALLDCMY